MIRSGIQPKLITVHPVKGKVGWMALWIYLGLLGAVPWALAEDDSVASLGPTSVPVEEVICHLQGEVKRMGSSQPLVGVHIQIEQGGQTVDVLTDDRGRFVYQGTSRSDIHLYFTLSGYLSSHIIEQVSSVTSLQVRYWMVPEASQGFETVVRTGKERLELQRHELSGNELRKVAGTIGDPFRVVGTLPGVTSVFSLVGYPLVRGTSPGSTGFLLDGAPIPLLYHLLIANSVIHPQFIDKVAFYPGAFPSHYGGYIGGIVDGQSKRVMPEESEREVGIDLLQVGGLVRQSLGKHASVMVAGRYGYPGLLLRALQLPIDLTYWDYQTRLDVRFGSARSTLFVFGARDELSDNNNTNQPRPTFGSMFHRADWILRLGDEQLGQTLSLIGGLDQTVVQGSTSDVRSFLVLPRWRGHVQLLPTFQLQAGLDVGIRNYFTPLKVLDTTIEALWYQLGGFAESTWSFHPDWQWIMGLRYDGWQNAGLYLSAIQPRSSLLWHVTTWGEETVRLQLAGGRYYQPPRAVLPFPGLEQLGLQQGLASAWQSNLTLSLPWQVWLESEMQLYFNYMDKLILDIGLNNDPTVQGGSGQQAVGAEDTSNPLLTLLRQLQVPQAGRTFGAELLVRVKSPTFFGWISYTLSRSERLRQDNRWSLFDFDRTHMLQFVAGLSLPRQWSIGTRIQWQSGRPISSKTAYNDLRMSDYYRVDLRIDKDLLFLLWRATFYVDLINVTLASESLVPSQPQTPYILPTLGFKAYF